MKPERKPRPSRTSGEWLSCFGLVAALMFTAGPAVALEHALLQNGRVEAYFSPNGGATRAIVRQIDGATQRVWLAGYSFSSDDIADAMIKAKARGVDVRAALDSRNRTLYYSKATRIADVGIDMRLNHRYAIMHHKFVVIDDVVGLGSMNFSAAGEGRNAENFNLFFNAAEFVGVYERRFLRLHEEGVPMPVKTSL